MIFLLALALYVIRSQKKKTDFKHMRVQSLILLISVVIVGSAGYYFIASDSQESSSSGNSYLLPGLARNLDDVTKVALYGGGDILLADICKCEQGWVVTNLGGYPADLEMLRYTLFNLAEARLTGKKTANPENYRKIGVEDISDTQAQGIQILIEGLEETGTRDCRKPGADSRIPGL